MATTIGDLLDTMTVTGELYGKLSDDTIECYACGHRCKIRAGRRGICQVRFNEPHPGVAPGQAAVIYRGEKLLGGGWIEHAIRSERH